MNQIDPTALYTPNPEQYYATPEGAKALQRMVLDLYNRVGGPSDAVAATQAVQTEQGASLTALDTTTASLTSQVATLNANLQANSPDYTVTNGSTSRSLDADAAAGAISASPTQAEVEGIRDAVLALADVVGTLVEDLIAKDVLG